MGKGNVDRRVIAGVFWLVSLAGTAWGQDFLKWDWDDWRGLTEGEKITFVSGTVSGSYVLVMVYLEENKGGPQDLWGYTMEGLKSRELVQLVERVYADKKLRDVPFTAILMNWRYWLEYMGG